MLKMQPFPTDPELDLTFLRNLWNKGNCDFHLNKMTAEVKIKTKKHPIGSFLPYLFIHGALFKTRCYNTIYKQLKSQNKRVKIMFRSMKQQIKEGTFAKTAQSSKSFNNRQYLVFRICESAS